MHPQRATFVLPTRLEPGDKVPMGRGPWAVVARVQPALGRPPLSGPAVVIESRKGRRRKVPRDQPLRAIRSPVT